MTRDHIVRGVWAVVFVGLVAMIHYGCLVYQDYRLWARRHNLQWQFSPEWRRDWWRLWPKFDTFTEPEECQGRPLIDDHYLFVSVLQFRWQVIRTEV